MQQQRLDLTKAAPDTFQAMLSFDNKVIKESGLAPRLIHLIKLRASIINGCAYCVDMHTKESLKDGLSVQWVSLVSVWREAAIFTDAERAVLGWVDAVTLLPETGAPDDAYQAVRAHFSETEVARITVVIGVINVWNRIAVSFRSQHPVDVADAA